MKQAAATNNAPGAPAFLSQALVSNDFVFVSGQIHALPDNTLVGSTTEEKVAQIMKNIEAILRTAEAKMSNIVKVVIYVTDMAVMSDFNKVTRPTLPNRIQHAKPFASQPCRWERVSK